MVMKTVTVAWLLLMRVAMAMCCCCCRRGSACRYDWLCFLVEVYDVVNWCRVLAQNRRLDSVVVNDPWLTNTAVICNICNLQPADLIHVSYRNEVSLSSDTSVLDSVWNGRMVARV